MSVLLNESSGGVELRLSRDKESEGFDLESGKTWIYPTNYSLREYQYNIIQQALFKNTLVSLPTGLGKTFIAAVVMFNFYRWYPEGKVIFMAPTRPLVKQQIDACYDITGIPKEQTIEMTGVGTKVSIRESIWNEKRVFFITPQILDNDLDNYPSLCEKIKCLVFDEAHRAKGNYAYCRVIEKLALKNKYFRVLALSATPGNSVNDVLTVTNNLLISHVEFRTEDSLDVNQYVFKRNLTTVVVPLGEKLQQIKDDYMRVLDYHTRTLIKFNIIDANYANTTKGKIFMIIKQFQQQKNRGPNYGEIMKCLNICITLFHAYELLIRHGLRNFLNFFQEHINKPMLRGVDAIRNIMEDIKEYLGPPLNIQNLPDGTHVQIPDSVKFGHPKYYKLREILLEHFDESNDSSRVIVFFEYRDSVEEAYALLLQPNSKVIKPKIFVGKTQGVTQKLQLNVVKSFRDGHCNVLLSTSIGEEGLDVGEVDLIVCFDISTKSPIRMVQRMGRTGRKKDGKVIVLVTEGKEQQTLKECLINKSNVSFHVLGSKQLVSGLQQKTSPSMIPDGVVPRCEKIFITVQKLPTSNSIKDLLRTKSSEPSFSPNLQIVDYQQRIPNANNRLLCTDVNNLDIQNGFNKKVDKQRVLQDVHKIKHSKRSELFINLLKMIESRKFNIKWTQINETSSKKTFKQTDIRNMFSTQSFQAPSTQIITQTDYDSISFDMKSLFTEIDSFLKIESQRKRTKSNWNRTNRKCIGKLNWIEPELSVYTNPGFLDELKRFEKSLGGANESISEERFSLKDLAHEDILSMFNDTFNDFEMPKSFVTLLDKYNSSIIEEADENVKVITIDEMKVILSYFKLESSLSIFTDESINDSQTTIIYSPDRLTSPILSSTQRNKNISVTKKSNLTDWVDFDCFDLNLDRIEKLESNSNPECDKSVLNSDCFNNADSIVSNKKCDESELNSVIDKLDSIISNTKWDESELNLNRSEIESIYDKKSETRDLSLNEANSDFNIKDDDSENDFDFFDFKKNKTIQNPPKHLNTTKTPTKTKLLNTTKTKHLNITKTKPYIIEDDEDDFEPKESPCLKKPKLTIDSSPILSQRIVKRPKSFTKSRKLLVKNFIEEEAEVSIDESIIISDDEMDDATQEYEKSFIADETNIEDTQMHAVYLKSVRSPRIPNRFKIPDRIKNTNIDVFSQVFSQDNTYLDDSFVVSGDEVEVREELSQLEILEKKLKKRKKDKPGFKRIMNVSDSE